MASSPTVSTTSTTQPPAASAAHTVPTPVDAAVDAAADANSQVLPAAPRTRKPAPIPTSDLLDRIPTKLAMCTRGTVDAIMGAVSDKNKKSVSHVRAVKQLVSVKTATKKQLAIVEKYVHGLLKDKQVPDVPACLSALTEHYRQQDCSIVSGKYLACGVKDTMTVAQVVDLDVPTMPLDEAKRVMPAWALIRAASEQGFQPLGVCNDKMVDGKYAVQIDGIVPSDAVMLHVARTKSVVSNGHTDALTVWNANSKCYPTKPVPRKLNNTQTRVLTALETLHQILSLDVEYEAPVASECSGAAAAAASSSGGGAKPASKKSSASKKRSRADAETPSNVPEQNDDVAALEASPKRAAPDTE